MDCSTLESYLRDMITRWRYDCSVRTRVCGLEVVFGIFQAKETFNSYGLAPGVCMHFIIAPGKEKDVQYNA